MNVLLFCSGKAQIYLKLARAFAEQHSSNLKLEDFGLGSELHTCHFEFMAYLSIKTIKF